MATLAKSVDSGYKRYDNMLNDMYTMVKEAPELTADTWAFAHARVFAPKFGYLEDPATGSGNSA